MTHSGGQPHRVGYAGQRYKITIMDADKGRRIVVAWRNDPPGGSSDDDLLRSLETRSGWSDAKVEEVENRETGDGTKAPPVCRDESGMVDPMGNCHRCGVGQGERCAKG